VAEIVKTRKGSGTLALDETTHRLFVPATELKSSGHGTDAGGFSILVLDVKSH
jgi:hypothetical protein